MAKRRNRRVTGYRPATIYEAQLGFLSTLVCDAVLAVQGERKASEDEIVSCKAFLESEKCARWLGYLNIEPDCLKRVL